MHTTSYRPLAISPHLSGHIVSHQQFRGHWLYWFASALYSDHITGMNWSNHPTHSGKHCLTGIVHHGSLAPLNTWTQFQRRRCCWLGQCTLAQISEQMFGYVMVTCRDMSRSNSWQNLQKVPWNHPAHEVLFNLTVTAKSSDLFVSFRFLFLVNAN